MAMVATFDSFTLTTSLDVFCLPGRIMTRPISSAKIVETMKKISSRKEISLVEAVLTSPSDSRFFFFLNTDMPGSLRRRE